MMPYCASRNTMGTPRFAPNQFSTRCDCAVTSGPMPSPPTTATLVMLDRSFISVSRKMDPRTLRAIRSLERPDFVVAPQRELDLIETVEQPGAPARVDLEMVARSRGRGDGLLVQVDADTPGALGGLDFGGKAVDHRLVDDDRKNAVLEAVGVEDVAKA